MEDVFFMILGLIMITGQVRAAVILFGGHKNDPERLKIVIGIMVILCLLSLFGAYA